MTLGEYIVVRSKGPPPPKGPGFADCVKRSLDRREKIGQAGGRALAAATLGAGTGRNVGAPSLGGGEEPPPDDTVERAQSSAGQGHQLLSQSHATENRLGSRRSGKEKGPKISTSALPSFGVRMSMHDGFSSWYYGTVIRGWTQDVPDLGNLQSSKNHRERGEKEKIEENKGRCIIAIDLIIITISTNPLLTMGHVCHQHVR